MSFPLSHSGYLGNHAPTNTLLEGYSFEKSNLWEQ
jgi:hypothetical protein